MNKFVTLILAVIAIGQGVQSSHAQDLTPAQIQEIQTLEARYLAAYRDHLPPDVAKAKAKVDATISVVGPERTDIIDKIELPDSMRQQAVRWAAANRQNVEDFDVLTNFDTHSQKAIQIANTRVKAEIDNLEKLLEIIQSVHHNANDSQHTDFKEYDPKIIKKALGSVPQMEFEQLALGAIFKSDTTSNYVRNPNNLLPEIVAREGELKATLERYTTIHQQLVHGDETSQKTAVAAISQSKLFGKIEIYTAKFAGIFNGKPQLTMRDQVELVRRFRYYFDQLPPSKKTLYEARIFPFLDDRPQEIADFRGWWTGAGQIELMPPGQYKAADRLSFTPGVMAAHDLAHVEPKSNDIFRNFPRHFHIDVVEAQSTYKTFENEWISQSPTLAEERRLWQFNSEHENMISTFEASPRDNDLPQGQPEMKKAFIKAHPKAAETLFAYRANSYVSADALGGMKEADAIRVLLLARKYGHDFTNKIWDSRIKEIASRILQSEDAINEAKLAMNYLGTSEDGNSLYNTKTDALKKIRRTLGDRSVLEEHKAPLRKLLAQWEAANTSPRNARFIEVLRGICNLARSAVGR